MKNVICKECGMPVLKTWINFVTKYICENKKCKNYDKPVNN